MCDEIDRQQTPALRPASPQGPALRAPERPALPLFPHQLSPIPAHPAARRVALELPPPTLDSPRLRPVRGPREARGYRSPRELGPENSAGRRGTRHSLERRTAPAPESTPDPVPAPSRR